MQHYKTRQDDGINFPITSSINNSEVCRDNKLRPNFYVTIKTGSSSRTSKLGSLLPSTVTIMIRRGIIARKMSKTFHFHGNCNGLIFRKIDIECFLFIIFYVGRKEIKLLLNQFQLWWSIIYVYTAYIFLIYFRYRIKMSGKLREKHMGRIELRIWRQKEGK
jgi:hypothetical protein